MAFGASRDIRKQAQLNLEQQARDQMRAQLLPGPQAGNAAGTAKGAPAEASSAGTSRGATPYEDAGKQAMSPGPDTSSSQAANTRAKKGTVLTHRGSSEASSAALRTDTNARNPGSPSKLGETRTPQQGPKLPGHGKLRHQRGQASPQRLSHGN